MSASRKLYVLTAGAMPAQRLDIQSNSQIIVSDDYDGLGVHFGTSLSGKTVFYSGVEISRMIAGMFAARNLPNPCVNMARRGLGNAFHVLSPGAVSRLGGWVTLVSARDMLQNLSAFLDIGIAILPDHQNRLEFISGFHSAVHRELTGGVRLGFETQPKRRVRLD